MSVALEVMGENIIELRQAPKTKIRVASSDARDRGSTVTRNNRKTSRRSEEWSGGFRHVGSLYDP